MAESALDLRPDDVLLLRTGSAERYGGTREYVTQYPGFDDSAATWLGERKIMIFVGSPSPDNPTDRIRARHHPLREPRQSRRGARQALSFLRLPAADPGRSWLAGPRRGDPR